MNSTEGREKRDARSQTASRKVRVVRARIEGPEERAGVLRRGARVEGPILPDGRPDLRDDLRRRHDDRRLRCPEERWSTVALDLVRLGRGRRRGGEGGGCQ